MPTDDTPRELFLVNLPFDASAQHIKSLFAEQVDVSARVERVDFDDVSLATKSHASAAVSVARANKKRKRGQNDAVVPLPETWDRSLHAGGCTAIVTFTDSQAADLALKHALRMSKAAKSINWTKVLGDKAPALGSARYIAHQRLCYPDRNILRTNVDQYMLAFEEEEARKRRALAKLRSEPDEDGFVTVTRGGRAGPARVEEATAALEKQKARHAGKEDFYRFQHREKKKEEANELLRGFQEDRRKVEEMKLKRNKFKPR